MIILSSVENLAMFMLLMPQYQFLCWLLQFAKLPPNVHVFSFLISFFIRLNYSQMYRYVKVKQSLYTPWRRLGGEQYNSYSFSTSALDGGEWSASRPGRALPPGKGPPVLTVQEAGWASELVWTQRLEEKSFRLCRGSNIYIYIYISYILACHRFVRPFLDSRTGDINPRGGKLQNQTEL
jgi:hypothetical protein